MPALTVCQLYRSATTATFLTDNTMAKRNKKTRRQKDKQKNNGSPNTTEKIKIEQKEIH
jgi:hypothetical protein